MSADTIVAGGAAVAALLTVLLAFRKYRAAGRMQEESASDRRAALIAKETADELARLYARLEKLERIVEELQKRDRQKQATIEDQAAELDRTNRVLAAVRSLFVAYAARVEKAWRDGHTMPVLTTDERAILEETVSREQLAQLTKEHRNGNEDSGQH